MITIHQHGVHPSSVKANKQSKKLSNDGKTTLLFLPKFLDNELLEKLQSDIESEPEFVRGQLGESELCLREGEGLLRLQFLLNAQDLFTFVQEEFKTPELRRFHGRIYSLTEEFKDTWHEDVGFTRQVAMAIHIGTQNFEGGHLEVRSRDSQEIIARAPKTEPGDAIFFRISEDLQHRVSPVTKGKRTVLAGWFQEEPDFWSTFVE